MIRIKEIRSLELFEDLLEHAALLEKVVYLLVAVEVVRIAFGLINDVAPVLVTPQKGLFAQHYEVPTRTGDGHVKTAAVLNEAEVARSHTAQNDDIPLRSLESVHCGDLDGF
jgi:hypothetical protein